jgi:hypothetical protein
MSFIVVGIIEIYVKVFTVTKVGPDIITKSIAKLSGSAYSGRV